MGSLLNVNLANIVKRIINAKEVKYTFFITLTDALL